MSVEKRVEIPYGKDVLEFDVAEKNLIGVYSPKAVQVVADISQEVIRALGAPIGHAESA